MMRAQLLNRSGIIEAPDLGLPTDVADPNPGSVDLEAADIRDALNRYNGVVSRLQKRCNLGARRKWIE